MSSQLNRFLSMMLFTLIPLQGFATVPCIFENKGYGGGSSLKFVFSKEECQFLETGDGSTVIASVRYPEMKLSKPKATDESLIILRMSQVSPARYNPDSVIQGKIPERRIGNLEVYRVGTLEMYRFRAKDNAIVFVSDLNGTYLGTRLMAGRVRVSYQYSTIYRDFEAIDDAVRGFLDKSLIR